MKEEVGCFNSILDRIKRVYVCWSDTNPDYVNPKNHDIESLKCRNCGGVSFEILRFSDEYRTIAKCWKCNMYFNVHCG